MGVKKRSKVSAEFSMSSLTDIIFLLLIFFMLTSSLVTPNALNLSLPGSSKTKATPSQSKVTQFRIERNGTYLLNGTKVSLAAIDRQMKKMRQLDGDKAFCTISPHARANNDAVVAVMNAAWKYNINASMLEPRGN